MPCVTFHIEAGFPATGSCLRVFDAARFTHADEVVLIRYDEAIQATGGSIALPHRLHRGWLYSALDEVLETGPTDIVVDHSFSTWSERSYLLKYIREQDVDSEVMLYSFAPPRRAPRRTSALRRESSDLEYDLLLERFLCEDPFDGSNEEYDWSCIVP